MKTIQDPSPGADTQTEDSAEESATRGRAGRRTIAERHHAILELLAGKASIQQLAMRLCVNEETIVRWRDDAVQGMQESLRRGSGMTPRERELETENKRLRTAFTDLAIRAELMERALRDRPPIPRRRSAK